MNSYVRYSIDTIDPVGFIAIDDGYNKPADALTYVQQNNLPVNPFLTFYAVAQYNNGVVADPAGAAYFTAMAGGNAGRIGVHGKQHIDLTTLSAAQQKSDLINSAGWLGQWLGVAAPVLFAPPYGAYNRDTITAAQAAGYAYIRRWTHQVVNGALVSKWGAPTMRGGDIVLCHFTDTLAADLAVAVQALQAGGLQPGYLKDYL